MTDAKREKSQPDDEVRYTGTGTYWYVLVRTGSRYPDIRVHSHYSQPTTSSLPVDYSPVSRSRAS